MTQARLLLLILLLVSSVLCQHVQSVNAANPRQSQEIPKQHNTPQFNPQPGPAVSDGQITNVLAEPSVWRIGTTVRVKWDWPGYSGYMANVSLWRDSSKVATIIDRWPNLSSSWNVPTNLTPGVYRVRVQSVRNPRNFADNTVRIENSTLAFISPAQDQAILAGSRFQVAWKYEGNPGPLRFELQTDSGKQLIASNIAPGTLGRGQYEWQTPENIGTKRRVLLLTSQLNSAIKAESQPFYTETRKLSMPIPVSVKYNDHNVQQGQPSRIEYYSGFAPSRFRVDVIKSYDSSLVETIAHSTLLLPGRNNVTPHWIPSYHGGSTQFKIRMTHLESGAVFYSDRFSIHRASNSSGGGAISGSTNNNSSTGSGNSNGGASSTNSGSTTKQQLTRDTYFNYNSRDKAQFSSGSLVTIDARGFILHGHLSDEQSLKYNSSDLARLRASSGVEFSNDYIKKGQLAGNQYIKYRSGKSAQFRAMSLVEFSNGYVTKAVLDGGSHSLEYSPGKTAEFLGGTLNVEFSNGYVKSGLLYGSQSLEYGSGKSARFRGIAQFSNGYVIAAVLEDTQYLEYKSGKSARFRGGVLSTEFSHGYVRKGQLDEATYLEYAPGKFKNFPAGSIITINGSGYAS